MEVLVKVQRGDDSHSKECANSTLVMHILVKFNDATIFKSVCKSKGKVGPVKRWYLSQNGLKIKRKK